MSVVVSVLSVPLTVRYLGAESYGVWMTISTMLAWLGLADGGFGNGLTNVLSEAYAKDQRDLARTYLSSVFWMLCLLALGIAAVFGALWPWMDWSAIFGAHSPSVRQEVGFAVAVTLGVFLVNFPLSVVARSLCAYQESAIANLWSAGGNIASLAGLVLATHFRVSMPWLIASFSGPPVLVTTVAGFWLFGFHKPWLRPIPSAMRPESMRKLTNLGGMFFIVQIVALLILQTDNLIIAHFLGAQAVTPYNVTWRLFNFAVLVPSMLMQSLWPAYAEAFTRGDGAWIRRTFRMNMLGSLAITGAISLPFVIFGRTIISHWAGPSAVPSTSLLVLMGVWSMINGAFSSLVTLLNGLGKLRIQMIVGLITAVANITLAICLVPRLGVEGVTLGTVISYLVIAVIPLALATKTILSELPSQPE
jgi:O-antigen/teichoic acid export membrane protein